MSLTTPLTEILSFNS